MMEKFTSTPWKFTISSKNNRPQISGENGHQVCLMWRDGEMEGNAHLIVRAVNNHFALVNCMEDTIRYFRENNINHNIARQLTNCLEKLESERIQ